jgi:hypothetical protein
MITNTSSCQRRLHPELMDDLSYTTITKFEELFAGQCGPALDR